MWVWVAAAAGALAYWRTAFRHIYATGFGDWQQFQHQWEAGYAAVMRYGEVPLWNPYHCGGVMLFGDPQAQLYSPFFLVALATGATIALKLMLWAHAAVGMAGAYFFARREAGLGIEAAVFTGVVWSCSGFFAWHGSGGHAAFLPFYLFPWVLWSWRKAGSDLRYAVLLALLMTLVVFEGGVYPFPYFCIALFVDGVVRLASETPRRGILVAGAVAVPLMLLLGALRFLPILDTLANYPRPFHDTDHLSPREFLDIFVSPNAGTSMFRFRGHEYVWDEYGAYIGWPAFVLGALGIVRWVRERRFVWLAGALVFALLTFGDLGTFSPWAVVRALPVFGSLRVPSRFAVMFLLYWSLAGGAAIDWAITAARRVPRLASHPRVVTALVLLFVAVLANDLWVQCRPALSRWSRPEVPPLEHNEEFHFVPRREYAKYASFPARNVGNAGCYTGMQYRAARGLREGNVPQHRFATGTQGEFLSSGRTQNTVSFRVRLDAEGRVVMNQTFARGWHANVGKVGRDKNRRLVVDLPAGEHAVTLRYDPPGLELGALFSGLGVIAAAIAWVLIRRRRS